jgi:VWFA-related protein
VIVLVDGMNNSPEDLTGFRKDLNHMLRSGPLSTPISLLVLNHTGFTRMAPTADSDVLMSDYIREVKGLRGMECTHQPGEDDLSLSTDALAASPDPVSVATHNESTRECLAQRFRISVDSLSKIAAEQRKTPGRTILIWLGGGWPVPTEQGMRLFNANDTERFYEQVIDLTGTLRDAHITLDAIGRRVPGVGVDLRRAEWDRAFRGAASRDALSRQSVSLVAQAHQSGGQVFVNSQHVEDALRACMRDAGSFYQLSFDSEPSTAANEFRAIEVRVNRPGVTVRSATTYYAQP